MSNNDMLRKPAPGVRFWGSKNILLITSEKNYLCAVRAVFVDLGAVKNEI